MVRAPLYDILTTCRGPATLIIASEHAVSHNVMHAFTDSIAFGMHVVFLLSVMLHYS